MMESIDFTVLNEEEKEVLNSMNRRIPRLRNSLHFLAAKAGREIDGTGTAQLSPLEKLPPELNVKILSFCDPVSVLNVAATGPVFHDLVCFHEENISRSIVCRNIRPDLRCLAAARDRAEYHGFPIARHQSGETRSAGMNHFCDLFIHGGDGLIEDHVFEGRNHDGFYGEFQFSLQVAHQLLSFHDTVQSFASIVSETAIHKGPLSTEKFSDIDIEPMAPSWVTQVSPSEFQRFEKALYLFDLSSVILPVLEVFDFDDPNYNLWFEFWVCFPPWEQHQVRCIQQMLQNWVDDHVQVHGGYLTVDPSDAGLAEFVIKTGLAGLRKLGRLGTCRQINAMQDEITWCLSRLDLNPLPPRYKIWLRDMDESYLSYDKDFDQYRLDASLVMSYKKREDSGPRDAWLHTLLGHRSEDPIFEPGCQLQFSCDVCMTDWGYLLWDRAKLDWHSMGKMPSTEEMLKVSRDVSVTTEKFYSTDWGRGKFQCEGCSWAKRNAAVRKARLMKLI